MEFLREKLKLRLYQEQILFKIHDKNSFVVLPTGTGKTIVGIALSAMKINKGKILIVAPTKPLCVQHQKSFSEFFEPKNEIICLTGAILSPNRKEMWASSKIICATPQTVESDLRKGYFSPNDFELIIIDEAHRAVGEYSYVWLANQFQKTSQILSMSASPASTSERLKEIKNNLFVEHFEFRGEDDFSLKGYLKEKETTRVLLELLPEQKKMSLILDEMLASHIRLLFSKGVLSYRDVSKIRKGELLKLQKKLFNAEEKESDTFFIISEITLCIKLLYLKEVLETQSFESFNLAIKKIETQSTTVKASKRIVGSADFKRLIKLNNNLIESSKEHPKLEKILDLVRDPKEKIIIFAQFRNSVNEVVDKINKGTKSRAKAFVGQKSGLTQKKQIEILDQFRNDEFNVLVATSVSEEGLHIENADIGIFFEPVPSALRTIQRRGRIGRINIGKVYLLIMKDTIDEKYYWVSYHKERKMYDLLKNENNY